MNERIKELANKAVGKRSCYMIEAEYIKFAELIVNECFTKLTPYLDDQFIGDIRVEFKEHFGVEE